MVTLSSILPPVNVTTVSGTLAVTNGGTGVTTSTGTGSVVLSNSPTLVTPVLGAASATSVTAALGSVTAPSFTFTGDTNTGIWSPAADTIAFSEGGVEAMRIDSSANVGIGLTSPGSYGKLASIGTIAPVSPDLSLQGLFSAANDGQIRVGGYKAAGTPYLVFTTATDVERMRITSAGNVGVGTISPNNKVSVASAAGTPGVSIDWTIDSGVKASFTADLTTGEVRHFAFTNYFQTFYSNNAERMRIDASGNVGIGTSSPGNKLAVAGGQINTVADEAYGIALNATTGNTRVIPYAAAYGGSVLVSYSAGYAGYGPFAIDALNIRLWTAGNERMRIDSSGNVGIGTNSPVTRLTVDGGDVSLRTGGKIRFYNSTNGNWSQIYNPTGGQMAFDSGAGEAMRIDGSGNVGIGTSSPISAAQTGNLSVNGVATVSGYLSAHQTNMGVLEYITGKVTLRAYGATAGTGFIAFNTGGGGGSTDTERMRITAQGDVAIGTTGLAYSFTGRTVLGIEGTNSSLIEMRSGGTQRGYIIGDANTIKVAAAGASTLQFETNGAERMRIDTSGKVGIGTTTPANNLQVVAAVANNPTTLNVTHGASGNFFDYAAIGVTAVGGINGGMTAWGTGSARAGSFWLSTSTNHPMVFGTNDTERMRIDSAGLVSIGTTATVAQLTVGGTGGTGQVAGFRNTLFLRNSNSSGNQSNFLVFGSAGTISSCFIGNDIQADGTTINRLDVQAGGSGGVFLASGGTSWTAVSDERGKDIIEPISNAVQKVSTLRAVIGKYKTDAEGTRRSFLIAQDVQAVFPEAVSVGTDDQQTLGVAYTDTIPLLVKAIQELTARVAQLEGN
jgi:hypothetical protein